MALALNRYIGNSIMPLLIQHARFYQDSDNYGSLLDACLHTVYRLSKSHILTKGQREAVSDFLIALTRYCSSLFIEIRYVTLCLFCREMQPSMLLKLLRKLTVDVSKMSEFTTIALRVSCRLSPLLFWL